MSILFYEPEKPFYEFSNFFGTHTKGIKKRGGFKLRIDGLDWISTEHYFQAQKFYIPDSPRHMEYYNIIHKADSPMKVTILGRQKCRGGYAAKWVVAKSSDERTLNDVIREYADVQIRSDWDTVRDDVMMTALMAKFTQNDYLKKILLDTGDVEIVEDSPRDSYWGWGKDKKGLNMLGKTLMKVRETLKK